LGALIGLDLIRLEACWRPVHLRHTAADSNRKKSEASLRGIRRLKCYIPIRMYIFCVTTALCTCVYVVCTSHELQSKGVYWRRGRAKDDPWSPSTIRTTCRRHDLVHHTVFSLRLIHFPGNWDPPVKSRRRLDSTRGQHSTYCSKKPEKA